MKKRDLTDRKAYRGMTPEQAAIAHDKHKAVLHVLSGLLLVMFLGMLANTIVSNAMPVVVAEIGGTSAEYAWILTSGIIANTVMTALSGKLADLFDKKKLFIISMVIFSLGSLLSGLAWSPGSLIAFRILQGTGMGMQVMLSMVIMATIIPPRERGRYNGYMSAVMAVATVSGPLIGGLLVAIPGIGWRGCFWIIVPFMLGAIWVIMAKLDLDEVPPRDVHLDLVGAGLIVSISVSLFLWVSMIGGHAGLGDPVALILLAVAIVSTIIFVIVERRSPEPLIPMDILLHRNTVMAIIAILATGTIMFGSNVFLGQYFQYGRGYSPATAGLLTLPMMLGITLCSTWVGQLITRTGRWKRFVLAGMVALTVSSAAMCFVQQNTNLVLLGVIFFVMGSGLGAAQQNLVLAVQNTVPLARMGAATSAVTFFRNFGGGLGIQILGAVYTNASNSYVISRRGSLPEVPHGSAGSLDFKALAPADEAIMREAFGNTLWSVFLVAALLCLAGTIAVIIMKGTSLRDTVDLKKKAAEIIAEDEADRIQPGSATTQAGTAQAGRDVSQVSESGDEKGESPQSSR